MLSDEENTFDRVLSLDNEHGNLACAIDDSQMAFISNSEPAEGWSKSACILLLTKVTLTCSRHVFERGGPSLRYRSVGKASRRALHRGRYFSMEKSKSPLRTSYEDP